MSNDSSNVLDNVPDAPAAIVREREVQWGPLAAILLVVLGYFAAQIVGGLLIAIYPALAHWSRAQTDSWISNSTVAQFIFVVLSEGILALVLYGFMRWRKVSLRAVGFRRPQWSDAGYAIMGFVVYFAAYLIAVNVATALTPLNVNQQQDVGFQHVSGGGALALTFVSLVVLPPLAEEFAFRGFLFSGLKKKMPVIAAALATSILFAAPHLLESDSGGLLWIAGVDTFLLSLVLCYLRQKTGRLWAGIGVHTLKNTLAFLTLFVLHLR